MYPGTSLTIAGETFVLPALSLGQLRSGILTKLQEHDALVAEGKIFETLAIRGEVILAALRRNYPDFSEDKLLDHLDMSNTTPLWLSIMGASGFVSGEAPAATQTVDGTSNPSTAA